VTASPTLQRRWDAKLGSVYGQLLASGGLEAATQKRNERALSLSERETISRGIAAGVSLRAIARQLGRSASTVCRAVARNGGQRRYRALVADERAGQQARRPKRCKLSIRGRLRRIVAAMPLCSYGAYSLMARWHAKRHDSSSPSLASPFEPRRARRYNVRHVL
jgi:hypothetical protein